MSKFMTKADYKPSKGVVMKGRSLTQLSGYVPSEKRVTDLLLAGLVRAAAADTWYDAQFDFTDLDVPVIPLLSRAFPADIADVAEVAREYKERARVINERIQIAAEKGELRRRSSVEKPPEVAEKPPEAVKGEGEGKPPSPS